MPKEIVRLHDNEPRAGTWLMSKGFKSEHRALRKLVIKYRSEFEEFGVVASSVQKPDEKGGRPIEEFLLNEEQAMYLGTLLTNTEIVRRFKIILVKEFSRQKKALLQRYNVQYIEARDAGKISRNIETDRIQEFVRYATDQGSKNAERYYANISKMENRALFFLEQKFKNLRDILDVHQLTTIKVADEIVIKALGDGMNQNLPYKKVYELAKERIENFAELRGKTIVPGWKAIE